MTGSKTVCGSIALVFILVMSILAMVFHVGTGSRAKKPHVSGHGTCNGCNVFIILMDALRPDHLGCYGYPKNTSPNIDAFAASAIRFDNVIAQASWTKPATASLLTGRYPKNHNFTELGSRLPDEMITLQEVLGNAGYSTAAFIISRIIDRRTNLAQGFQKVYFTHTRSSGMRVTGSDILTDAVISHLGEFGPSSRFYYIHYMDTHKPYFDTTAPTTGKTGKPEALSFDGEAAGDDRAQPGRIDQRSADMMGAEGKRRYKKGRVSVDGNTVEKYDNAIRFNDRQIGRLFETIKNKGLWDNSIIIVMADHGEAFGEHGEYGHYLSLYDEEIRVPFIMKAPGVAPRVVEDIYSQVDIMPTVLSLLGMDVPPVVDGIVMLSEKRKYAFSEYDKGGSHFVSARTRDAKVIHRLRTPKYSCHDLGLDPGERNDISGTPDARCSELKRAIDAFLSDKSAAAESQQIEFNENDLQQLKALGYVD